MSSISSWHAHFSLFFSDFETHTLTCTHSNQLMFNMKFMFSASSWKWLLMGNTNDHTILLMHTIIHLVHEQMDEEKAKEWINTKNEECECKGMMLCFESSWSMQLPAAVRMPHKAIATWVPPSTFFVHIYTIFINFRRTKRQRSIGERRRIEIENKDNEPTLWLRVHFLNWLIEKNKLFFVLICIW